MEKTDLDELKHPYFMNKQKPENIPEKVLLNPTKDEKILLFSPHPDDEILGACGLLEKCYKDDVDIKVIYMTSGKTAGSVGVRQEEAKNGIKKIGGKEENLLFVDMPFYDKKPRIVSEEDNEYVKEILRTHKPTTVFICADLYDPNLTHKKCYEILMDVLMNKDKEEFANVDVYFYYSVWYWPEEHEYTHILPYDYDTYKRKIYAMLEHQSQLETKYMGNDPRPFYQRSTGRDGKFGKIHNYDYCEVYYKLEKN